MDKRITLIITSAVGFSLLFFLLSQLNFSQWKSFFLNFAPNRLVPAFFFYLLVNFARTIRVKLIFNKEKPRGGFLKIFCVLAIHNLLASLLPARTGETSFIYLTKRVFGIPYTKNIYILIFLRLLDMIVVFSFFVLALISFKYSFRNIFFYLFFVLFLFLLIFHLNRIFKIFVFLLKKLTIVLRIKNEKIENTFYTLNAVEDLTYLKRANLLIPLFLTSFLVWLLMYASLNYMTQVLGVDLGFYYVIFGTTGVIIASFLPISGFGGFGGVELGWVATLVLSGIEKSMSIPLSFGIHVINLLFAVLLGLFGIIVLKAKGRL